jgi:hypothetical protein
MPTAKNLSSAPPVIPTLVEVNQDGLYLRAYCPLCDKSEQAKVEYLGQPRQSVASVARIRAHLQKRHRRR